MIFSGLPNILTSWLVEIGHGNGRGHRDRIPEDLRLRVEAERALMDARLRKKKPSKD